MFKGLFGKNIQDVIGQTKKVTICGVDFTIRKVNILDHLSGAQVLMQSYDIHKTASAKAGDAIPKSEAKIKRHYGDILVAGLVDPEIVWKRDSDEDKRILVDDLLPNWEVSGPLYTEIMTFTYGKKKVSQLISAEKDSSKSI